MTVKITDHALVRWLERVHGTDMEKYRAELAKLAEPYVRMKCQHAEIGGVWFVFDGALLVTVVPTQPKAPHRHDRYSVNGSGTGAEKQTWQSMKRKRSHK